MKSSITRQSIYLLALSTVLLIFVFVFSFAVLIPEGKEYRSKRSKLKKESVELARTVEFHDETATVYKKLKADNSHIIGAFSSGFSPEKFEKQHKSFFNSLMLSKKIEVESEDDFSVYEVNTSSKISSPKSFYNFLDTVNKSDWIISINLPIDFKRDGEIINSSFKMKVYGNKKDLNSSKTKEDDIKK
ncbi:hypothetical protein [Sulfurimonas sp.]|uniref:hypothetical protein n=1 Tax=Sulfurimonas sp. TaxID=2022749 RepID=UPI0026372053|nr:hypothetical protein [Sulfurimonas sp.]MDD5157297.1 hypothetical protein [Sulfurimonas sp.]